jgi:hypothetical protein
MCYLLCSGLQALSFFFLSEFALPVLVRSSLQRTPFSAVCLVLYMDLRFNFLSHHWLAFGDKCTFSCSLLLTINGLGVPTSRFGLSSVMTNAQSLCTSTVLLHFLVPTSQVGSNACRCIFSVLDFRTISFFFLSEFALPVLVQFSPQRTPFSAVCLVLYMDLRFNFLSRHWLAFGDNCTFSCSL